MPHRTSLFSILNPAVAVDSNGKIGFTWVREPGSNRVKDIYFTIREANGSSASSIIKVTNNPGSEVNELPTLAAHNNPQLYCGVGA